MSRSGVISGCGGGSFLQGTAPKPLHKLIQKPLVEPMGVGALA